MSERKPYPSDLSDEQWSLIEPVITAWKDRHRSVSGHQGAYDMREIVNAILYQGRTGCQWVYLPHDLPQKSATYYYFAAWRDDGTDQVIHELLRCQVRESARRLEDPTLVVLDTQSVHVAAGVPASTRGHDPAKRVPGRKRGVDVLGLVITVVVLSANTHDNAAGIILLDQVAEHAGGSVRKVLVDQGFKNKVVAHGAGLGIDVEIVQRNPQDKGFVPQPKRWRVEQTYGILILHRCLVRDYEHRPSSSASRVLLGYDPRHDPTPHRRERPHLARHAGGDSMHIQPLLDALGLQEDAARALADDLRAQIDDLQTRLREAETHLEHLAITRKTVTGLADRLPATTPTCQNTRTTPASSQPSTTRPGRYGPRTSAKPSATNCCRRTSKAPAPS